MGNPDVAEGLESGGKLGALLYTIIPTKFNSCQVAFGLVLLKDCVYVDYDLGYTLTMLRKRL
jgi:hypothetical protein